MEPDFDLFLARLRSAVHPEPLYGWAMRVGINKASLNSVLARKTLPKVELLLQLASALGCSVDWLLGSDLPACAPPAATPEELIQAELAIVMEQISAALKARLGPVHQAMLTPDERQVLQAYRQADANGKQAYLGLAEALGKQRSGG